MFFPGETITHRFIIPFHVNEIDHVIISYMQNEAIILEKRITSGDTDHMYDVTTGENSSNYITCIEYQLSQGEALLFNDEMDFTMQINVYSMGGTRHTSHLLKNSSGIQYYKEVMSHE